MLCPESRKTSRGSPTAQGKNWPWKRKLTRCAGSPHDTGKKKRPAPVSHGRSEGDFPNFSCHAPAGGAPKSGGMLQKKHSNPGETPPRQGIRQAVSSGRKFPPAGKPPGQDRRKSPLKNMAGGRKVPINELCTPLSPSQQEHAQVERNVRNRCLPEKGSPRRKACCGTCRCAGGPREKISTGP